MHGASVHGFETVSMRKPKYTPRPLGLLLAWHSQGYSNVAAGGVCSRASLTSVCIMKFWEVNILVNSYAIVDLDSFCVVSLHITFMCTNL